MPFEKILDYGESEVLALALEIGADMVIVDEVDARRIAELHSIKKIGFLGLLVKTKKQRLIENVKDVLDAAISRGLSRMSHLLGSHPDILGILHSDGAVRFVLPS